MKRPLLPALLLAAATAASAQAVYRCGPDGSEYRQTPCPGGQALSVADPRTEAQRGEAAQRAQRDAELAQGLRQQAPASAGGVTASSARSAKPAAQPAAERKPPANRHHGKRHRAPSENARTARAPAEPKPAKTSNTKAAKSADAQP